MSTASGNPSKKMGWYRSMMDKLDNENRTAERIREENRATDPEYRAADKKRAHKQNKPAPEITHRSSGTSEPAG